MNDYILVVIRISTMSEKIHMICGFHSIRVFFQTYNLTKLRGNLEFYKHMRNKWSSRRPFVSIGPCEYIIVHILEILELSLSLFQMVYIRESCLKLKTTKWNSICLHNGYLCENNWLWMDIFYVGAEVEFIMSSKHILQNNFQNFEVKKNEIIN
jgi:hypothetical protein